MDEESRVKQMTGTIMHLLSEITQLRAENEALREAHGEQEMYLHEAEFLRAELAKQRELMSEIVHEYDGEDNGRTLRWKVDEVRQYLTTRRNK